MYIVTTTNTFQTNFTLDDKVVLHLSLIGVGGNPDKFYFGRQGCFFNKNKLVLYNIEYIPDKFQITEGGSPVVT